jgi:release factor glutamine methyltransferase
MVPSPLVGEGQGGGEPETSEVGVPPTPNPSPQGGGESGRSKSEAGEPRTVGWALRTRTAVLVRAGIEGAGGDVRRLVAAVLDVPAAAILRAPERVLTDAQLATLESYVARRANREPVSRILGCRDFYGRSFTISPATLDPRPESETLVAAALQVAGEEGWEGPRILDVGTGSGCLLITLLCELEGASGTGTDISAEALAVARGNGERLGVAERASWLRADLLETVAGRFHMLVANPPYVRSGEIQRLEAEVRDFDPRIALDGGADGLAVYRRLAAGVASIVPQGGWVVVEVGYDQADAVLPILSGLAVETRIYLDVAGKRRCVAVKTRDRSLA